MLYDYLGVLKSVAENGDMKGIPYVVLVQLTAVAVETVTALEIKKKKAYLETTSAAHPRNCVSAFDIMLAAILLVRF